MSKPVSVPKPVHLHFCWFHYSCLLKATTTTKKVRCIHSCALKWHCRQEYAQFSVFEWQNATNCAITTMHVLQTSPWAHWIPLWMWVLPCWGGTDGGNILDNMALERTEAMLSKMLISFGMCRDRLPAIFSLFLWNPPERGHGDGLEQARRN